MDTVVTIGKVALQIKKAVETARQNKEDCDHVVRRVNTLHNTVLQYKKIVVVTKNEAVRSALDEAKTALAEALRVVTDCQEERNIVCVLCCAGELSKELRKVNELITSVTTDLTAAVMTYLLIKVAKPWYQKCLTFIGAAFPKRTARRTKFGPLSLPEEITEVAEEIKEATEAVHRNRADFMEIEKRASSVGALMSPLENYTALVNQEEKRVALAKLLETFNTARGFVNSYRGMRIGIILRSNQKLVKELDEVLDGMLGGISEVNVMIMNDLDGLQKVGSERLEVKMATDGSTSATEYKQGIGATQELITT